MTHRASVASSPGREHGELTITHDNNDNHDNNNGPGREHGEHGELMMMMITIAHQGVSNT